MSQNIALNSLDFAHKQSVCGPHGGTAMTRRTRMATAGVVLGAVGMAAAWHDEKREGVKPLAVREITEKLDDLTADELKALRELEKRTKDRESLIERIDSKIRANS